MVCLYCGSQTQVINSRRRQRNNQVWRRRKCLACQAIFTSSEAVELESALSVNADGRIEPFIPDLLLYELINCLKHRSDAYTASRELLDTIVQRLLTLPQKPLFTTNDINRVSAQILKRFDRRAYLRWCVEHPSLQEPI